MTKRITSGALQFINRALGLTGEGEQTTNLDDGHVSQTLDIARLAAASQGIGGDQGTLWTTLRMTHAAAGDVIEIFDPYNPGTRSGPLGSLSVPFQNVDLWLLGMSCIVATGNTLTVDNVEAFFDPTNALPQINDGVLSDTTMPLARWNSQIPRVGAEAQDTMINGVSGYSVWAPVYPFRWPREGTLQVASQTSGAGAATVDIKALWAMSNEGLRPSVL